ncbi:MAG: deaminase [archaeon]|nr:deaminase [archaeon]
MEVLRGVDFQDFKRILRKSWSKETTSDPKRWSEDNPAWGQCAVTSVLAQDVFGEEIVWAEVALPNGEKISHYFNSGGNFDEDFSKEQFPKGTKIPVGVSKTKEFNSTREYVLSYEPTRIRYNLLKSNFKEKMDIWRGYMNHAWNLAEKVSPCKKMKFGAVLVLDNEIISEGVNHFPHKGLQKYCEPTCIREGVPSGTKGELYPEVHAEADAITKARKKGYNDLSGALLYVAGKFPDGKRLIKDNPGFYCTSCAVRIASEKDIQNIVIPSLQGEVQLSLEEIIKSSFDVALEKRNAY